MTFGRHILIAAVNLVLVVAPWVSGWSLAQSARAAGEQSSSCCGEGCCCCQERGLPPACPCAPATPKPAGTQFPIVVATIDRAVESRPAAIKHGARLRDRILEGRTHAVHTQDARTALSGTAIGSRSVRSLTCINQT